MVPIMPKFLWEFKALMFVLTTMFDMSSSMKKKESPILGFHFSFMSR